MNAAETLNLDLREINLRLIFSADAVRDALEEYRTANSEWVEAERDYRHARAVKSARLKSKLAKDREDELFLLTEDEWLRAEQAKVLRDSSKEALRATQTILSGVQSVAAAHRAEAQLAAWEPSETRSA
jgi:hypothetical protein